MKIGHKLILGIVTMALLIGVVEYVAFRMSRDALQDSTGASAVWLAGQTMAEIDEKIYVRTSEMQMFAQAVNLAADADDSNQAFSRLADLESHISAIDLDWKAGKETPMIGIILSNSTSRKLRNFTHAIENEMGYSVFNEAYVTNAHGVIIGSTGRTSSYLQAGEDWRRQALNEEGLWVGDLEYDAGSDSYAIDVVISLYDGDGEFAGIFKAGLNIEDVRTAILKVQSQSQFYSMAPYLVDRNGSVIFSGLDPLSLETETDTVLREFGLDASSYPAVVISAQASQGFLVHVGARNGVQTDLLTAFSRSEGHRDFKGLGWSFFVEYETSDILSPISRVETMLWSTLIATLTIAFLFAFFISQSITRRINRLVDKFHLISRGQWAAAAQMSTGKDEFGKDEIGQLSSSFNRMAIRLKEAYDRLEARTRELEESQKGLEIEVSERKLASEELQVTLDQLSRSNKELEEFANIASHDLQEPLRMVSSYTQLLERRYKDKLDDDANEFIGYAVDGAKRMQNQINDLLAYSRVTTQGSEFKLTDCSDIFDQAASNLTAAIEESGVVLTRDPLPMLAVDSTQLISVFQNLIGNAIKFRCEDQPRIHVSAVESGDEWVFSVRDNGIGIEAAYAERIFLIFQRLHGKAEYAGTGIGLAICKKVVERHGGRIWVESELGNGSSFYFTFPVSRKEEHDNGWEIDRDLAGGRQSR